MRRFDWAGDPVPSTRVKALRFLLGAMICVAAYTFMIVLPAFYGG